MQGAVTLSLPPNRPMTKKLSLSLLALGALGAAGGALAARRSGYRFAGRTVLLTGGSRGLGLAMARLLVDAGARVALLARSREGLEAAVEDLRHRRPEAAVKAIVGDVTKRDEVEAAVVETVTWGRRLDLLINNAGLILCAPFENHREKDFEEALDAHLRGPLHAIRAALPHMRHQGGGRILNISSVGGKIGVPHLSAYCASKYALVGLSHTLAAELRGTGIRVTVACPGLMRTGSHRAALFGGQAAREYAWFAALANLPVLSSAAETAARKILEATRRGRAEIVLPLQWRLATSAANLWPPLTIAANRAVQHLIMPTPAPGAPDPTAGRDTAGSFPPPWWVRRSEEAAVSLHQS
jgi:NAD(P)-dependent dehydrogenase (short-subunit alcohol dehydrogenase family)